MHSLLQHQRNTRQRYFHVEGQLVLHLPELTVPVSHQIHRGFIRCIEGDAIPRQISITPSTIQEEINNLHHVYRSYLARSSFATVDALPLAEAIMDDKAAIVSDGYYLPKSDIATAAWIFRDVRTRTLGRGYCRLPGRKAANDSTRAEIFGLFLCLITSDCICSLCLKHFCSLN